MPQELVTPDEFLTRLTALFAASPSPATPSTPAAASESEAGTVWLTHKRFAYDEDADAAMDPEAEHEVLIRATQGETKFSARIPASSLPTFHAAYGSLLKNAMAPRMRRRDKKKERARAEAATARRKELYVDVKVGAEGKRGAGRRQRQRKLAAQKKKENEREKLELRDAARASESRDD